MDVRGGVNPPENTDSAGAATTRARSTLQPQVEDLERTLPMPGLRVLEMRIDDLERARERDAESTADSEKLSLGFLAEIQIERGAGNKTTKKTPQVDSFFHRFKEIDETIELRPILDRLIARPPLDS